MGKYNSLFLSLANQSNSALIILDDEFNVFLCNENLQKITGKTLSAGCTVSEWYGVILNQFVKTNEFLFTQDSVIELPIVKNELYLKWYLQRICDDENVYYFLKSEDLKEKTSQDNIFQLNTLLNNMPCNVYWVDTNCQMISCNLNVLEMLGMTLNEFKGKTYEEISSICNWPEGLAQKLKQDDLSIINTGEPIFGVEDPPIPRIHGGVYNFLTSRVPLRDKSGKLLGVAGISMDISSLKEARAKAQIAIEAKTQFIANMGHDIRTPLAGITGLSNLLKQRVLAGEERQFAHWIYESSEQLLHLLNQILEMVSAEHAGELDIHNKPTDLYQCIDDLIALEKPMLQIKSLIFMRKIADNVPRFINIDQNKLNRILLNLVDNAIKFTEKGHVGIEVSVVSRKKESVRLLFKIFDTGIGIPTSMQSKVFERFFKGSSSAENKYQGHGVGLHIVQSYIRLLGGQLALKSEEGLGTSISFEIPVLLTVDQAFSLSNFSNQLTSEKEIFSSNEPSLLPEKLTSLKSLPVILLVEDNLVALKVIEMETEAIQCQHLLATTAREAFWIYQQRYQDIDLIITDIGLPCISGIDLTQKIRAWEQDNDYPPVPIVGLTAHAKQVAKKQCMEAGMNDVYTKPISRSVLKQIFQQFLSYNEVS